MRQSKKIRAIALVAIVSLMMNVFANIAGVIPGMGCPQANAANLSESEMNLGIADSFDSVMEAVNGMPLLTEMENQMLRAAEAASAADVLVHLPFDGNVNNGGTSGVQPSVVGPLKNYSAGYKGQALYFDTDYSVVKPGSPAPYVDLGGHDDLKFGADTDFSIAFWIQFPNLTKTDGWPVLISNKGVIKDVGWQITTDAYENIRWQMTVEGKEFPEVTIYQIKDTNWHHFAVTHDRDGSARFYIEGVEVPGKAVDLSVKQGTVDTSLTPKIGVNGKGVLANVTRDKLNVSLDDMRIYRGALSTEDVAGLAKMTQSFTNRVMLEHVPELAIGSTAKPVLYEMQHNKQVNAVIDGMDFRSSDEGIATIEADGMIKALAAGETMISAHYEGFQDSFKLSVKEQTTPPAWQTQLRTEHPRLMATTDDFEALKQKIETDAVSAAWYENVKQQAATLMDGSTYNGEDPQRILLLGMMYQLTKDKDYADRAWLELQQLFIRPLWDPDMFLELSARLMSAAFAYDWFYDAWTEEQRSELRKHIIEKGMMPGIVTYRLGDDAPYATNYWLGRNVPDANNWNTVSNAGQLISALAIGDEVPYLAGEIMENGMTDILYSLEKFNPHGGWFEGYAYWNYTWIYLVRLLGSIDTALGAVNNPLASFEGLSESGYFPIYLTGATSKAFNFGDSGTGIGDNEQMYYLANRYNKPEYTQYQIPFTGKVGAIDPLSLLWYNPQHKGGTEFSQLPLDKQYTGIEIGAMRQSWSDPDGISINFKAGAAQNGHMDLDAGSFVLDALGEQWFSDLGDRNRAEWPNFFSTYGPRWTYYTKRAEGHNTLVLNPKQATGKDGDTDQTFVYNGDYRLYNTPIEILQSYADKAYSIMDLTKAYNGKDVSKVRRGIAMLDDRQHVLLQDEIQFNTPGEVYSFLHFNGKASATVADDGKSAMLMIGEKRMWIGLLDSQEGDMIQIMDAKPLATSPNPAIQYSKPGVTTEETPVKKLAVHLKNRKDARISLLIVPLGSGENPPTKEQLPGVAPLSDWSMGIVVNKEELATAISIAKVLHDNAVEGTEPGQYPEDSKKALNAAIIAAQAVWNSEESTQADVDTEVDALNVARVAFEESVNKDPNAPIITEALSSAISVAQSVYGNAVEGTEPGQYPVGSKIALDAAIKEAQDVIWNSEESTQADIDAAVEALNAARVAFEGSIVPEVIVPELTIPTWHNGLLSGTNVGTSGLALNWSGTVSTTDVTAYQIYKDGVTLATVTGSVYSYAVTGLNSDTLYTFKVEASNGSGQWSTDGPSVALRTSVYISEPDGEGSTGDGSTHIPDTDNGKPVTDVKPEIDGKLGTEGDSDKSTPIVTLTDIVGHWASKAIEQAIKLGIINGYSDHTFHPNAEVTRAEFATMLGRALKLEGSGDVNIIDLDGIPAWARGFVTRSIEAGIIKGYTDNTFRPTQQITRVEITAMIVRALNLPLESNVELTFKDADKIPAWARSYVAAAVKAKLVQGRETNEFAPWDLATRAEAVTFILALLNNE
ncbi:S-layer homology domain-containing protein [Paenibacillus sp. FA6]|uniref:S-layer homology domain-containing protein n=1 Tax=Paenibacillus sp. FA6 TaxID=3413029 RepID=UPI003F65D942